MELRLNEPDFLFRVVQMIRSLKRKRERSFFPPTVFYIETGAAQKIRTFTANILFSLGVISAKVKVYRLVNV